MVYMWVCFFFNSLCWALEYIFYMNLKSFCSGTIFLLLLRYFPVICLLVRRHIDPLGFLFIFSTSLFPVLLLRDFPDLIFQLFYQIIFCWQIDLYYLGGISWCLFIPFSLENACCTLQRYPKSLWECTLEAKFPPILCTMSVSSRIVFCICSLWCLSFRLEGLPLEDAWTFMLKNKSIRPCIMDRPCWFC